MQEDISPVKVFEYMAFGVPFVSFDLLETRSVGGGAGAYAPARGRPGWPVSWSRCSAIRIVAPRWGASGVNGCATSLRGSTRRRST